MLRSPAEYYIKYLCASPRGYSDAAIKDILVDAALDFISEDYIKKIRERLPRPVPFRPTDRLHAASSRFLYSEGLYTIFRPDKDMLLANQLLKVPAVKEFLETMILSHAPPIAIANAIAQRYQRQCTQRAVEHYKHYYWNVDLLDTTQMRALLTYRVEVSGEEGEKASKEQKAMKAAAKKASYTDPRRLASELPYSPVSALMAQMRLGTMPSKLEVATTMVLARQFAVLRAAEATMGGGSDRDSQKAVNFTMVAKMMGEMLETVVKPDENLRKDLERIALRTDMAPVPSIHQLSDGEHTVDLLPKEENDDAAMDIEGPDAGDQEPGGGEEGPGGDVGLPGGG